MIVKLSTEVTARRTTSQGNEVIKAKIRLLLAELVRLLAAVR